MVSLMSLQHSDDDSTLRDVVVLIASFLPLNDVLALSCATSQLRNLLKDKPIPSLVVARASQLSYAQYAPSFMQWTSRLLELTVTLDSGSHDAALDLVSRQHHLSSLQLRTELGQGPLNCAARWLSVIANVCAGGLTRLRVDGEWHVRMLHPAHHADVEDNHVILTSSASRAFARRALSRAAAAVAGASGDAFDVNPLSSRQQRPCEALFVRLQ